MAMYHKINITSHFLIIRSTALNIANCFSFEETTLFFFLIHVCGRHYQDLIQRATVMTDG